MGPRIAAAPFRFWAPPNETAPKPQSLAAAAIERAAEARFAKL